jgi:NADH:ubiquinone oxidoreductase subunit F (NADH-binding)
METAICTIKPGSQKCLSDIEHASKNKNCGGCICIRYGTTSCISTHENANDGNRSKADLCLSKALSQVSPPQICSESKSHLGNGRYFQQSDNPHELFA